MVPGIFLDRDGVIIENRSEYVRNWDDVAIFGQALTALARIKSSPYRIVVVTNQSAVGRGIISLETVYEINNRLVRVIEQTGGRINDIFICPHAPKDNCDCRKPKPGLIHQAVGKLSLDLMNSILIGDTLSDIKAGQAAGVNRTALVRTGLGNEQVVTKNSKALKPFFIYTTLADALADLVEVA